MSSMVTDDTSSSMIYSIKNIQEESEKNCDPENGIDFTIFYSKWISVILNTVTGVCVLSAVIIGWGIVKHRARIQNW